MRIVIDAGHGPETAGKRSPDGSLREFQFNSVVADYVREELRNYDGINDVLFVHEKHRDVPLKERTDRANQWRADVYVSIHANAFGAGGWNSAQGIETFVYTTVPVEAKALADVVQAELIAATGRPDRGVKSENFHVLRETDMTSILVECGFMTNHEEAALLKSDEYRRKCAKAIANGLAKYYGLERKAAVQMSERFNDVPANHWALASILKADKAGVISGVSADKFGLSQPVTREQLAVILDRIGVLDEKLNGGDK